MNTARPWYFRPWGIFLIIILGLLFSLGFAIAFSVYGASKDLKKNNGIDYALPQKEMSSGEKIQLEGTQSYWVGSNNPKITIVIFSDFGCPVCRSAFPKLREISLKYGKSVKIIYRDYPVVQQYSKDLAMAGRCAGEQGFFWLMYDKLFTNQGVSTKEELVNLGNLIGLDSQKFSVCLENKLYEKNIDQDLVDGTELEVSGTPTWFINGNKIEGDVPLSTLIKIIEANL